MNILIAPNSMKGSLDAFSFAHELAAAFCAVSPDFHIRELPVGDGGDFTSDVLIRALDFQERQVGVLDPLGRSLTAAYGLNGTCAVIEMARASGMKLLSRDELNPLKTSSYGTGQLILDAVEKGANEILLAVGGSATVDMGMGLLEALGVRFFDSQNNLLHGNGFSTGLVDHVDFSGLNIPATTHFRIICDVENPLLGTFGAARVFGPQKGASDKQVEVLEANNQHFLSVLEKYGKTIAGQNGSGAAGGIAVGMSAFLQTELVAGADFVLNALHFDEHVQWADWVITGEGKLDKQTLANKAPFAVLQRARKYNKRVAAIAGVVEPEIFPFFDEVMALINDAVSVDEAIMRAKSLVYCMGQSLAKRILMKDGN